MRIITTAIKQLAGRPATVPAAAPVIKRRWSVATGQNLARAVIFAS